MALRSGSTHTLCYDAAVLQGMTFRVVLGRSGDIVRCFETRENARYQARVKRSTLLKCALPIRTGSLQCPSSAGRKSSKSKCQVTTAVAAVDQEPIQPARTAKPTAEQIFDMHHVSQLSPSLLLYFPIGTFFTSAMHRATCALCTASFGQTTSACRGAASKHTHGPLGHFASCRCGLAHRQQFFDSM